MIVWRGYPQAQGSHPTRPWWKRGEKTVQPENSEAPVTLHGWLHPSGAFAYGSDAEDVMARYDEENPLPAPLPQCNQVWSTEHSEKTITRIEHVESLGKTYVWAGADRYAGDWPPRGYVLVYGPSAPWADTGK